MTEGERLAKKIYALAYHRATAAVVERHQDEFKKELELQKVGIRLEYEMFGTIETARNPKKHVEAEGGVCEFDGQEWPCRQARAGVTPRGSVRPGCPRPGPGAQGATV
jgi:hypothetical protein